MWHTNWLSLELPCPTTQRDKKRECVYERELTATWYIKRSTVHTRVKSFSGHKLYTWEQKDTYIL